MVSAAAVSAPGRRPTITRGRLTWEELVFWPGLAAASFVFPSSLPLLTQVLISGLFAMSLDILLGYAGIASLGHAVFFGVGAYLAGYLAQNGWGEPMSGLVAAALLAGITGYLASLLLARTEGIALFMLTLALLLLCGEVANRFKSITGGQDGMQGITISPLFGLFEFDFIGKTAFWYAFAVSLLVYAAARRLMRSAFGLSLEAIRENERRAAAVGIPVRRRIQTCYAVSAAAAGVAGGLFAQTTQYVALEVVGFDRSIGALIMAVLGGIGTLLGSFVGAAVYTVSRDYLSALDPTYWNFWLGLFLFLIVSLGRGGLLGGIRRVADALHRRQRVRSGMA